MYIQRLKKQTKNKVYHSVLLRENYREDGKVKHRTIANLSKLPPESIAALDGALKGKELVSLDDLKMASGRSFGGIEAIEQIADKLGITKALGSARQGKLAMIQIASRIISPSSRRFIAREWQKNQALDLIFKIDKFSEDDLYDNLDWLEENQAKIEKKIFKHRYKDKEAGPLFLYDVTSTYLEGDKNELAEYGYNRDKKNGKKQIVIGLLTDSEGYPITVEVFNGNTSDPQTVASQLEKLQKNFGVKHVVFVGDKGMVKKEQIELLMGDQYKWDYITTITKPQIEKLINDDVIQLDMFDDELAEIEHDGVRYISRKNNFRAKEIAKNRESKFEKCQQLCELQNEYLEEHPKASADTALKKVQEKIEKLRLSGWLSVSKNNRELTLDVNEDEKEKASFLDGCYVMKTNVSKEVLTKDKVNERYKDLACVESAFRTMKTTIEDLRPVYVRLEKRTRGHVFVCMLAYMIAKYIREKTISRDASLKHVIQTLDSIKTIRYIHKKCFFEKKSLSPMSHQKEFLDDLGVVFKKL